MRIFTIAFSVALFIWLPFEDENESIVTIFAIASSIWLTITLLNRKYTKSPIPIQIFILAGLIAGVIVTPLALLLMAFKTGLHAHLAPDFTNQQIISVIYRTPYWLLGGVLIGSGLSLLVRYQDKHSEQINASER